MRYDGPLPQNNKRHFTYTVLIIVERESKRRITLIYFLVHFSALVHFHTIQARTWLRHELTISSPLCLITVQKTTRTHIILASRSNGHRSNPWLRSSLAQRPHANSQSGHAVRNRTCPARPSARHTAQRHLIKAVCWTHTRTRVCEDLTVQGRRGGMWEEALLLPLLWW